MPAGSPIATYNTGQTDGMNNGTTQSSGLSSGAAYAGSAGNANIAVGSLVGLSLALLVAVYLLGFRGLVDVSVGVGRK